LENNSANESVGFVKSKAKNSQECSSIVQGIIGKLISWRRFSFFVLLISLLGLSTGALRIQFENSVESFLSDASSTRQVYRDFQAEFGDDQLIVLVLELDDVFTPRNLKLVDSLVQSIEKLERVRKVRAITNTQDIVGSDAGFEVKEFISPIPTSEVEAASLKAKAIHNPLYQIDLVALDGRIPSIVIEAEVSEDENRYRELLDGVRDVLSANDLQRAEYYLAGDPIVELKMTQDMWSDLELFIPLTYLCLAIILWVIYRDLQGVLTPLIVVSLGMGALQGTVGYLGITMNAVTVGLPSLMLCVGILDCVHLLTAYRNARQNDLDHELALKEALSDTLVPCFQTSLTTAIGFSSVAVSELIPIREFGLLAAYCTAIIYPICFLTMPFLLGVIPISSKGLSRTDSRLPQRIIDAALRLHRSYRAVLGVLIGITCAALYFATHIEVETNHLRFIYPNEDVRIATNYIEDNLGGVAPFEIVIDTKEQGGVYEPELLGQIDSLQVALGQHPLIDKTVSPVQFIKEMHQAMNAEDKALYVLPDSRELIAQYILTYSFSGRENDLDDYVDYEFQLARIRGRMKQAGSREVAEVIDFIKRLAKEHLKRDVDIRVTGHSVLQTEMLDILVKGQIWGLLLGLFLMLSIIALIHRSTVVGLFVLVPNILPIVLSAGIMGFFGISLNAGTAMTACIAFGLIVDDTIFFLFHARRAAAKSLDANTIVEQTLRSVGRPVMFTSSLLAIGFSILIFGHSIATVNFGLICGVCISLALLMDLVVLPIMIISIPAFRVALSESREGRGTNNG
jgi:hypothetical protein